MIGRTVGSCELLTALGEGAVGQVFAGIDRMLDRPVAVKVLRPEYSRDQQFIERFRAEAAALARLSHTNIAGIYSLARDGDEFFMIMELVRGVTLDSLLLRHGRFEEATARAVAIQVLDGLHTAHAGGIIHRDIKPSNLMITADGLAKIMDFGIARIAGTHRATRFGHIVGTLAYVAPEQIIGREPDARTDIYSLGIVLYEMLTGQPPFVADTEYSLLKAQVEQLPPPLLGRVAGISGQVADVIMRCLAKDPVDRPSDAASLSSLIGLDSSPAAATELLAQVLGPQIRAETATVAAVIERARANRPAHTEPRGRLRAGETRLVAAAALQPAEVVPLATAGMQTVAPRQGRPWLPRAVVASAGLAAMATLAYVMVDGRPRLRPLPDLVSAPAPAPEPSAPALAPPAAVAPLSTEPPSPTEALPSQSSRTEPSASPEVGLSAGQTGPDVRSSTEPAPELTGSTTPTVADPAEIPTGPAAPNGVDDRASASAATAGTGVEANDVAAGGSAVPADEVEGPTTAAEPPLATAARKETDAAASAPGGAGLEVPADTAAVPPSEGQQELTVVPPATGQNAPLDDDPVGAFNRESGPPLPLSAPSDESASLAPSTLNQAVPSPSSMAPAAPSHGEAQPIQRAKPKADSKRKSKATKTAAKSSGARPNTATSGTGGWKVLRE